jgi:hypothetical protein
MTPKRWVATLAATFAFTSSVAASAFAMPHVLVGGTAVAGAPVEKVISRKCSRRKADCITYRRAPRAAPKSDYQQYWADKLPFGTSTWWDQMLRENRGGNSPGGGFGG